MDPGPQARRDAGPRRQRWTTTLAPAAATGTCESLALGGAPWTEGALSTRPRDGSRPTQVMPMHSPSRIAAPCAPYLKEWP